MSERRSTRHIVVALFPGVQSLDVSGPVEVFCGARRLIEAERLSGGASARSERPASYEVHTLSAGGRPVRTSSGLTLVPDGSFERAPRRIDTLIVPGGDGTREAVADRALLDWIAQASAGARRTVSVCTGAFLLAAAGLLDGRRATTHWASAEALARRHPDVTVDPDPIFVRDGDVWSSAGVTAGMDLALALVEEDHDRELALAIARHLVLFLRRPGNQSQFSATLAAQQPEREPLREVQRSVVEHVAGDHSVDVMAQRAHMSPRHFARAFRAETGHTPARYVERVRVEAARRLLEDTAEPVAAIAAACGFGTAETLRRVFLRTLEVGPAEYRRRFQASGGYTPRAAHARTRAGRQSIIKKEKSR
ncbi:MAG TPA: GlxA family transcriptional regulator [Solirubrobacteraceae bacterium]|nr:GlxA family transcriptional regulator [Solirubrobacteraceae bacterium]